MRLVKETLIAGQTPEELLANLEVQIAIYRSRSRFSTRKRILILTLGVLFVLITASAGLLLLAQQAPRRAQPRSGAVGVAWGDHP